MNRIYLILALLLCQAILKAQTDSIPPVITCPPADTVTLGPGGECTFQYFYAVTSGDNEPGDTLAQLSGLESGADFPLGNTVNVFQATDAAGNTATCSFTLTVQQYFGALTCKSFVAASIGPDCKWQPDAGQLLDGNFGCPGGYFVEVDKEAPYGNGPWVPGDFGPGDLGKTYIFRVTDTLTGNTCQGNIKANDMLPPVLTCQNITISCAVADLSPFFIQDSLGIAGAVPFAEDACGQVFLTHIETTVDSACTSGFVGVIHREWTAQDEAGNSSTCVQSVFLTRPVLSDLHYPADASVTCYDDISPAVTGLPYLEFAGRKFTNICSLGAAFTDSTVQNSACGWQVLRTWFALDWCTGDALDTVQVIHVQDTIAPEFLLCPDSTLTLGDSSATNDLMLWNAPHWANPPAGMENLCEGPADLNATVEDGCSGVPDVRYLLFLDLDNNGTQETVVDSDNPPSAGTVNFGNAANPNYSGGESRSFDERPVDSTLKYRFALQQLATGNAVTGRVVWSTDSFPSEFATPQLPHGVHKIRWIAGDSCGNETICEYNFTIKDTLPPSIVCPDTTYLLNISPSGFAVLYLQDLSFAAIDNCAPSDSLQFGMRRTGTGMGFPVDPSGNPMVSATFFCFQDFGEQQVELWAKDPAGNAGFCIATIDVQDSEGLCEPTNVAIGGTLKAESSVRIKNAVVLLQSGAISLFDVTDDQGVFLFQNAVPFNSNYTVTPSKNTNHLDGVSTFDLVLISKHILGLESLDSPYKIIAADANHSNTVTTFDVVEIRKLILGIYDSLPNNTSWRFVDKDFVFPDPANPLLSPFPESITRMNVQSDQLEDDFIGVKTGDVNGTAQGDPLLTTDDRSKATLFFDTENRETEPGEEFTVQFAASEVVLGYQFTLNTNGLEVLEILPGKGMTTANFAVFSDALTASVDVPVTESATPGAFAIKFRATRAGRLSDMLSISSRITRAEAYQVMKSNYGNYSPLQIALRFHDGNTNMVKDAGFELYQNQPNPFHDNTIIGFKLRENTAATLTIFNETGLILHTQSGFYPSGYHEIAPEKSIFKNSGVLYYKLETATDCAVRKMILMK